ncbi:hypothetical protein [Helicobacter rodentium]|nr:hypothetical protein [Helicobacter rodentium]
MGVSTFWVDFCEYFCVSLLVRGASLQGKAEAIHNLAYRKLYNGSFKTI